MKCNFKREVKLYGLFKRGIGYECRLTAHGSSGRYGDKCPGEENCIFFNLKTFNRLDGVKE